MVNESKQEEWVETSEMASASLVIGNDTARGLSLQLAKAPLSFYALANLVASYEAAKENEAEGWAEVRALIDQMPD